MKSKLWLIAVVTAILFSFIACDDGTGYDDGGIVYTFDSIPAFKAWLEAQQNNTPKTAYSVKLNVDDLDGDYDTTGSVGKALRDKWNIYVSLDLSGSNIDSIGDIAFSVCTNLTGITIPDSVTSIGSFAFGFCTSLTGITIPDSVTSIGSYAFEYCTSLTGITIPNNVTSIGSCAFECCTSLTSVTISDSSTSIGDWAFSECKSLVSVTIGNGVTRIGIRAFSKCKSLASVTIPNSITGIGSCAFEYCTSLTSVTFATGSDITDTNFGEDAFPEESSGYGGNALRTAYSTEKAGTYTRVANGSTWEKTELTNG